jgi:CBS domain-containing protein
MTNIKDDLVELLRVSPPFSSLSLEERDELVRRAKRETYPQGRYVFREGMPSTNHLFVVVSGLAEIVVSGDGGMETVVGYRRRGDIFGETVLFTKKNYPASARAAEDLVCLLIPRRLVEDLMLANPSFASFFSQILAERLRELYSEALKEQVYDAYRRDYFLFQEKIANLMSSPVITCLSNHSATEVSQIMRRHGVGSVLVVEEGSVRGAITERDLVQKVMAAGADPRKIAAKDIMNTEPVSLPATASYGDALVAVSRHPSKYLLITDQGQPAGVVSIHDLLRARSTGTLYIAEEIETQETLEDLARTGKEVDRVLQALVAEKGPGAPPLRSDDCVARSAYSKGDRDFSGRSD